MSRCRRVAAGAVAASIVLGISAQPASAVSVTTGATGFASAGFTGTAQLHANLSLTGSLGGLLDGLIAPIVNDALNPLVAALQGTASNIIGAALGPSSSLHAASPTTQGGPKPAAFPADLPAGIPSPCTAASATQPCYRTTSPTSSSAGSLASATVSLISGYTQQTPAAADATTPIFGRAQSAGVQISVLPGATSILNPVVSTGAVDSMATCPNDGTTSPTAQVSAANVSVLGGKVTFGVANGVIATITVNGVTYPAVDDVPVVTFAGITVQSYGDSVAISLPLTLAQVVAALGLGGSVVSTLLSYGTSGTGLTLTFVLGPNVAVTKTTALAWGLGVGADLSGSLNFNLLGVVGATVSVPTGITGSTFGNLLDLRLAYTSCQVGAAPSGAPRAIPVQLV